MHRLSPPMACGLLAAALACAPADPARAQPAAPDAQASLQVAMETRNGDVTCGASQATVPARSTLHLRVANRSEQPLWLIAPRFFAATTHLQSAGFALDVKRGGFSVAPDATATVVLRTPEPGQYPFSCHAPGATPNPASSGFIIVEAGGR